MKNITSDSFIWEWMGTKNDGKDWNILWKINYKRKKVYYYNWLFD